MQAYSNPSRESDPYSLPDVEVFFVEEGEWAIHKRYGEMTLANMLPTGETIGDSDEDEWESVSAGWFWQTCFPGCLPDGEPNGPFETEAEALEDARG